MHRNNKKKLYFIACTLSLERKGVECTKVLITIYLILMHLLREACYSDQCAWSPNVTTIPTSCLQQTPLPLSSANKIQTESLTCPGLQMNSTAQHLLHRQPTLPHNAWEKIKRFLTEHMKSKLLITTGFHIIYLGFDSLPLFMHTYSTSTAT